MYKIVGVGRAKAGKVREAIAATKAITEYMSSKHDVKIEVYLQQFGPAGTIYLIGEQKDLAGFQAIQEKIMASEEWEAGSTSDDFESVNEKLPAATNLQPVPIEECAY